MKTSVLLALLGASTSVVACLTEFEKRGGHAGNLPAILKRQSSANDTELPVDANAGKIPMGSGDRFNNGNTAPRGAGSQTGGNFTTFLSYAEVESSMRALAKEFKSVEVFDTPYKTYENRTVRGIKVAGKKSNPKNNKNYNILLQGGIHPRERGSSDHLIYFAADLLWAAKEKKGLTYGGMVFSAKQVQTALDVGFVLLPAVNPDGAVFDQEYQACWRKNRNPADATPGDVWTTGVDLNRNFDIAWNTTKYLASEVIWAPGLTPKAATYPGRGPFSEPESQNLRWTLDSFPDIGWFADVHSYMGIVGYGRCTDSAQSTDKDMNWRNPAYDSVRGIHPDRPSEGIYYKEYMDAKDLDLVATVASRMASSMREANEGRWTEFFTGQIAQLAGTTTGCTIDHTYARHILDKKKKKVHSLGFEFGNMWGWILADPPVEETTCAFYPTIEQYNIDMNDVGAAFITMFLAAAELS